MAFIIPWPLGDSSGNIARTPLIVNATITPPSSSPQKPTPRGAVEKNSALARKESSSPPKPQDLPPRSATKMRQQEKTLPGQEVAESAMPMEASDEYSAQVIEQAPPPAYPAEALQQRLEGCILAAVDIDDTGGVERVTILASDHPGVFDETVIESQQVARYAPARRGGIAQRSRVAAVAGFVLFENKRLDCHLRYADDARRLITSGSDAVH